MWMMVMFDLPTETHSQRKSAAKFRKFLLDEGFEMVQFSVYVQFTGTWESSQKFVRAIKKNNPQYGDVNILFFTDKQFSNIIHIENRVDKSLKEEPLQFELFCFYSTQMIRKILRKMNYQAKNRAIKSYFFKNRLGSNLRKTKDSNPIIIAY